MRSATALAMYAGAFGAISPVHATDVNDATARGAVVFSTYCVLCHGPLGKGDGRAAALQDVRPSDLSKSSRSVEYRLSIIGGGGASMNRSNSMPAWSEVLTPQQIAEVVAYIVTLREPPSAPAESKSSKDTAAASERHETPP